MSEKIPPFGDGKIIERESDKETLEQQEETIELPFSLEDFRLFKSTVEQFKEKTSTEDGSSNFKKAWDFAIELRKKYGVEVTKKVALFHIIIGSSGFGLNDRTIEQIDFEGEDSIADFINKL